MFANRKFYNIINGNYLSFNLFLLFYLDCFCFFLLKYNSYLLITKFAFLIFFLFKFNSSKLLKILIKVYFA